jgi:hypothetical protein
MMRISKGLFASLFIALTWGQGAAAETLWGFTNFPHDLTAESTSQVHALTVPRSNLYAQHMDQCVPWVEVLSGAAFPAWLRNDLAEIRAYRQPHQAMYVAVTPTQNDRHTLAEACGAKEGATRRLPAELRGRTMDDPVVIAAYLAYVRGIADALSPRYMNIGIEMSELALRYPDDWPAFATLFRQTVDGMHASHPGIKVGMELVLQSIMAPRVGNMVRADAEYGDWIGISFYPYGGAFGELFGAPRLSPPPAEWRDPFAFLASWTSQPIAIAETGYATATARVNEAGGIDFPGTPDLQRAFLRDVVAEARARRWLFVVWFVPVDYTRLYDRMAASGEGAEWMKIWMHTGLFDASLAPKPALSDWPMAAPAVAVRPADAALRCATPGSSVAAVTAPDGGAASEWTVRYAGGWEFCSVPVSGFAGARGLSLHAASDPAEYLMVAVDEADGDRFVWFASVGKAWARMNLAFRDAALANGGTGDGRLDPGAIVSVTYGDGGGADGATGRRTIRLGQPEPFR